MNVIFAQNSCTCGRTARHLVILLLLFSGFLAAGAAMAVDNIQSGHAGAEGGDWGGAGGAVIGPADNTCANMGAVGKVNLTSGFGFNIPVGAIITGATAFIKAGENGPQDIDVQLASDATVDPPTLLGSTNILAVLGTGGSCLDTTVVSVGGALTTWGNPVLTPAIVNASSFGMVFTKIQASSIKVDAVCLEIAYTRIRTRDRQQDLCFQEPPPTGNTITVVKTLVGDAPVTDWEFHR